MTEFITRNYGNKNFEIIIKTDSKEHYKATEDFARKLIDHTKPTIEAKPVVHAYWVDVNPNLYIGMKCSLCGARIKYSEFYHGNHRYCHKCGAQMDGTDTNVGSKTVKIPVISMEDVPKLAKEMEK